MIKTATLKEASVAEAQDVRGEWFGMKLKKHTRENYRAWRADLISSAVGNHKRVTLGPYVLFCGAGDQAKAWVDMLAPTTYLQPPTLIRIS